MAKLTTDTPTLKPSSQGIMMQKTSVGSGSRPTPSKIMIPTSQSGVDPETLGRVSPGTKILR